MVAFDELKQGMLSVCRRATHLLLLRSHHMLPCSPQSLHSRAEQI